MSIEISIRNLTKEDYQSLSKMSDAIYRNAGLTGFPEKSIKRLLRDFPEGQLCIDHKGKPIAVALSIIVNFQDYGLDHIYKDITNYERLDTHNPYGDILYGIEIFVHPEFRGLRLGHRLYEARKNLCKSKNLKGIIFGGRIPNYHKHANEMTVEEYIEKVQSKEIHDPVLNFQLSNGFELLKVVPGYLGADKHSCGYGVLLKWNNPDYKKEKDIFSKRASKVRLGIVQWQVRPILDINDLYEQIEFFTDAISSYRSDFIMFPEFFNTPLMAKFNNQSEPESIRSLAKYTPEFLEKFKSFAISYNVNIITGSMPLVERGKLYNCSYLCRRDGTFEQTRKIHITPSEIGAWGMLGGKDIRVFDTDAGRIAILICYDIEFPELGRILARQGVQIIFVPFQTDTKNGYLRVRKCAEARAIENECYVAIAGCVGNLPKVSNMDINYSVSAVFSPCDFAFPTEGIISEATPNTETMIIADINLDLLKELHNNGTVRNLKNRRLDLYKINWKERI